MIRFAALALICGACSSTYYTEDESETRVLVGASGLIKSKVRTYTELMDTGKRIVIDGQLVSADAFIGFSVPGVCYTQNAVFSPHAASYLGLWPARAATERLTSMLPKPLGDWFRGNIAYYDWIGFAALDYAGLLRIWPEGALAARLHRERQRHSQAQPATQDRTRRLHRAGYPDIVWANNTTPRKRLGFLTPAEAFLHQLRCCT